MSRWPRGLAAILAAAVLLWLLACWPLLAGSQTLFFRDLFGLFAPLKAFGAEQLQAGSIPALNPDWALGQPFRGNPNASAFYPTNLFYLVLPFWTAFNLHLCLHWLLGGVAMFLLARGSGRSRRAAAVAGLAYGGGGWMMSALSFYNVVAVAAWWPLVMLGALRGGRRGIALGGLACGMALLAGEPVMAALGLVPLAVLVVGRWGWRRGLATATAIGVAGLLVALPQVVASARVVGFSFRGSHGVLASQAETYRLRLPMLLDLAAPLPFGDPTRAFPVVPFYYSLYPGAIATFLALAGLRRRPALGLLVLAAVLTAWAPGVSGRLLTTLLGGLVRSPEKTLFWLALVWPLLAAVGMDAVLGERRGGGGEENGEPEEDGADRRWSLRIGIALSGALLIGAGAAAVAARTGDVAGMTPLPRSLLLAAALVGLAAWAVWRRLGLAVVGLQLLALLPMQALLFTEPLAPYRGAAPWTARLGERRAVLPLDYTYPSWQRERPAPGRGESHAARARRLAFELGPVPGVLAGLTYPLAPDLDGLHHRFFDYVLFRTSQDSWERRLPWLRTLGVEAITSAQPLPPGPPGPALVETRRLDARTSHLYTLDGAAPQVWWPRSVVAAPNPAAAYELVASRRQAEATSVLPFAVRHQPGGEVRLLRASPDRVELTVAGGGGVVVVRRAFQPLWQAQAAGRPLQVLPVDVALTGIAVPPGRHRVDLFVVARPETAAAVVAGLSLLALLALLAFRLAVPYRLSSSGPPC